MLSGKLYFNWHTEDGARQQEDILKDLSFMISLTVSSVKRFILLGVTYFSIQTVMQKEYLPTMSAKVSQHKGSRLLLYSIHIWSYLNLTRDKNVSLS